MQGRRPLFDRRATLVRKHLPLLVPHCLAFVLAVLFLLPVTSPAAQPNGGDVTWQYRDLRRGKQNPAASVVDSQGNVIITGSEIVPGSTSEVFYTVKISRDGAMLWRGTYNKPGFNVRGTAVTVDAGDNVYVTGIIDGANPNLYTIRYDRDQATATAVAAWQKEFDGGGIDNVTSIVASGGYVYVGGSSRYGGVECFMALKYAQADGTLALQIPNGTSHTIGKAHGIAADNNSIALTGQSWSGSNLYFTTIRFDQSGVLTWEKQYTVASPPPGFVYNDSGQQVGIDSTGNVIVTGYVTNGANFDIQTINYKAGDGSILWQQPYAGQYDDMPTGLHVDRDPASLDNVYVTGNTFTEARNHIYTAKYCNNADTAKCGGKNFGEKIWGTTFSSGYENHDIPSALIVDAASGNLFVVGFSEANGNSDFRIIKYGKGSGVELWTRTFAGTANRSDRAVGVGLDPDGHPTVAGYADETAPLVTGSVTAAGASPRSVIEDTNQDWTGINWAGYFVKMTGTNNGGEIRQVVSNTATTLTLNTPLPNDMATGDTYYIYNRDDYDYYAVKFEKGALEPPAHLVATTVSSNTVNLSWNDYNAVTPKFRVERCTAGTANVVAVPCNFDVPAEITVVADGISATATQDTGLDPDKYYYYRVRAYTGSDFATALHVTYPSNMAHAVTQAVGSVSASKTYTYTGVANSDDYALAIAASPVDGKPVVTGKSFFDPGGFDYYTIRFDRDLNKLWSQRYNDPEGQSDVSVCLAIDHNNQIVISGYAWLNNLSVLPNGMDMNAVYTIKYKADAPSELPVYSDNDPDLINQWTHQYNGPGAGDDRAVAIAATADSSDNIAVVGMGLHSASDYQKHDMYVLHYPPNGPGTTTTPNPGYWAANPIHRGDDNQPTAVAFDPWGNVIVTGFVGNLENPADPASAIHYRIYTAKFAAGSTNPATPLWERTYDSAYGEANDVAIDSDGNIFVTGFVINGQGDSDFVTLKYDKNGTLQAGWPVVYDGPAHGDDEAISIKVDPIDRNIVVAGNRLTDSGNDDVHVIHYRATDGAVVWQKTLLRESTDEDMFEMAMDPSGSIYITATTTNTGNIDPSTNKDILTFKVDGNGNIAGDATLYGSTDTLEKPYSITANKFGEVYVAGIAYNGAGNADYVIQKLDGDVLQAPYPLASVPRYSTVTLNWSDNSRAETGYQVARRDNACPAEPVSWLDGDIITTTGADVITYTDSGRTAGTTYCYGVRAKNDTGTTRWVNVTVTAATPPGPVFNPNLYLDMPNGASDGVYGASPAILYGARASSTTSVRITWGIPDYAQPASSYQIFRCTDSPGNTPCSDFAALSPQPVQTPVTQTVNTNFSSSYIVAEDSTVCPGAAYRYMIRATGTGWSADSPAMGIILPTPDNLVADGGFDSTDPGYPWFSPVGSNLASEPPTFTPHLLFPDNSIFGAWGSSGNGMKLTNDTSAVSAVSDWTRTTTPTAATVGAKLTTLNDTAPLVQQGWKSKRALTGLSANTVYYAQITRDATSTDGSEPQYGYLDLRIYDTVNNTELPTLFVSGMASTTVTVWFKTGTNTNDIYAYYGNATAPRSASAVFSVGTTGRKQPVLVTTNGRYDFSARVKSNLDRGVVYVNLSQQGYPYTISSGNVAANTDSRIVIDGSNSAGSNVLNHAFNKDGNWHLLSQIVTANWGSSPAINSYHYVRTYIGPSPCDYVGNTTCSTTSGTASGGTYYPAFNASGTAWIDDVRLVPNYNLAASTLNESQISLSWVNSSFDATGYKIERCSTAPCDLAHPENWNPLITMASVTTTSYIDWGLTPGTTYSYRVYPYKSLPGACNGGWNNNPASVIGGTYSNVATAVSANNPPVLTATAPNTTQVNLSWTDPTSSESEFQIVRGSGSDCAALSNLKTLPFNTTNHTDTDVCNGTTYSYCVKALERGLQYSDHTVWVPVTITGPQSNFQTKITIASSQLPGIKSDFSDLRFYDATAGLQIPYWIESMIPGSSAVVWFKTNNSANKVYLYYGNPNAVSASDGSNVFEFFDGFDGSTLSGAWSKSTSGASTIIVSGGLVTLDASMNSYSNRTNYLTMSKGGLTPPYRLEARTSVSAVNLGQRLIRIRGLGGIGDTGLYDSDNSNIVQAVWNGSTTGKQIPTDTFVRWRADHLGGSLNTWSVYQENGTVIYSTTYTGSPSGISISVGDGGGGNGKVSFDWVLARKYAAVEPAAVLGTPGPANAADLGGLTYGVIWESPFSKPTAGSPSTAPTIITTPAKPGAPTISSATGQSESQITVNWTFNPSIADQSGFDLDRCTASDCSTTGGNTVTTINIPDAAKRSYVDGGLAPSTGGTSYWYRIRAYKSGDGVCRWDTVNSSIVSGSTKSMTALKPTGFAGKSGLDTNNLGAVSTNCDDIRVTRLEDNSSETVLPLYLQNKNGGSAVCGQVSTSIVTKVDLPVNASSTYYLYYGKSDAPNVSDGSRVFTFFDDFDSPSLDVTKWDLTNSNVTGFSLSAGNLVGSNSSGRLLSLAKFPPEGEAAPASSSQYFGYTLQVRAKGTTPPSNGYVPAGFFNGGTDHLGFRMGANPVSLTATPPQFYYFDSGLSVQAPSRPSGASDIDSMIYQVRPRRSSTSSDMYLSMTDINLLTSGATTTYWDAGTLSSHAVTSAPIALGRRYDDNNGASYMNETYAATWDWVRVRKYSSPGPLAGWVKDGSNNPIVNTGTFSVGGVSGWKYQRPFTITNTDPNALNLTGYEQNVPGFDTSTAGVFPVTDHVTLTWFDTTATEDGFAIYRCSAAAGQTCTPAGPPFATIGPLYGTGGTATYIDGATTGNTAYCYTVRAYAGNVSSPTWITDAPNAVCKTTYNPGAPTALAGSASGSRVDLVWTDNSIGESGYRLERCSTTGCNFSTLDTIDTVNNRTYVLIPAVSNVKNNGSVVSQVAAASTDPPHAAYSDTGVGCSGVFRYRISAYFQADAANTLPTDPATAVSTGDITVGSTPAAPTINAVNRNSEQQLTVTWSDSNSTKSGYQVYRCAGAGCSPATVVGTITNPATLNFVDLNGVMPGTTYGYAVKTKIPIDTSCNPDGYILSPVSATMYGTTSITPPSNFSDSITNNTQVYLTWNDSTASEAGYSIRRCTGTTVCTGDAGTTFSTSMGVNNYSDSTACSGTAYTYQITPNEQPSTLLANNGGQAAWGKKAPLVINNFRANFVTRFTVNELPGMQLSSGVANFNDIRFYDETAGTEIPYWIEYTSADTPAPKNIRVYIKTGANNNIWLYYGNGAATSASNRDAVFGANMAGFWPFTGGATLCGGSNNVFPNFSTVNGPTPTAICNNTALQGVMSGTGVTGVTGIYTTGLQFDGSAGYVKVADPGAASALDITDQVSIEAWYQYQKSPDWARIVSKSTTDGGQPWEVYGLWLDNSSDATATNPQQRVYFGIGSADSPPTGTAPYYQSGAGPKLTPGQWYHIVGKYDSSTGNMSIVVNGTEYGLVNFAAKPKIINNDAPLYIGGRGNGSANWNPAKGIIDEVRLFSRALRNDEIATRYLNIPAGSAPSSLLPSVIVGPQSGKVGPVRVPLSFSAFQANSLGKIVISRDPANSVIYMTRPDFRDVRLYDRDGNREIPYWIRKITRDGSNNPVSAEVWFMTGATSAIDLSYGNSGDNNAAYDLVGYWPFEEAPIPYTSGQTADFSDWGMTGSLSGSFTAPFGIIAGGKSGNGLSLNGTSNYVSVADTGYPNSSLDLSGSLTVETWFKYDKTTQTNSVLVGKANSAQSNSVVNPFMMYLRDVNTGDTTSRQITFRVSDGVDSHGNCAAVSSLGGVTFTDGDDGTWHHVVGRFDNTTTPATVSLFVDGALANKNADCGGITSVAVSSDPLTIGGQYWQSTVGGNLKGMIDEVRIYNRPLSDPEILARSSEGATLQVATIATTPRAYWPFEESAPKTSGQTADMGGSSSVMNGTLNGFTSGNGIVVSGKYGNGLKLNPAGSTYVSVADTAVTPIVNPMINGGSMTVELWYYHDGVSDTKGMRLLSKLYPHGTADNQAYALYVQNSTTTKTLVFLVGDASGKYVANDPAASFTFDGKPAGWYHIVGRYDAKQSTQQATLFVNNVPYATQNPGNANLTIGTSNEVLTIGCRKNHSGTIDLCAPGSLDEVRIYNDALPDGEVAAHFASTAPTAVKVTTPASTVVVITPAPGNVAKDPDFENNSSYWNGFWPNSTGVSYAAPVPYSGWKSLKLTSSSTLLNYQSISGLIPGGTYTLSGYISASLGTGGSAYCRLENYATDVNYISPAIQIDAADARNKTGWVSLSTTITLPMTAPGGGSISQLNLACAITGASNTAWFDMVQLAPVAPVITASRVSEAAIDLNWKDIFGSDKTGYNIYRCMDGVGNSPCTDFTNIKQVVPLDLPYRDDDLQQGKTYRYKVTAYKTASCPWESAASNVASAMTDQAAPVLQTPVQVNSTTLRLTWNDTNATETGYNIYRCTNSGCTPTEALHDVPSTRQIDLGLRARYAFSGNVNDTSGNNLALTYSGTPTYEENGIVLTSISDLAGSSSPALDADDHTIEFDVKFRGSNYYEKNIFIYSPDGSTPSPGIYTATQNRLRLKWVYNAAASGIDNIGIDGVNGTEFTLNRWYRIRGVKSGSSLKIYVNDGLVASATVVNPKPAGSARVAFGPSYSQANVAIRNFSIYAGIDGTADPTLLTYTDTHVCPETFYNYKVVANQQGGWGESVAASNVAGNTTPVFGPPTGISAKAITDTRIDVTWTANSYNEQTAFLLKECPGSSCATAVQLANTTAATRTGLSAENQYCYQLASRKTTTYCNGIGGGDATGITSAFSPGSPVCVTTTSNPPTTLTATPIGPYKIQLEWFDESADEETFEVQKKLWNGQWATRAMIEKDGVTGRHKRQYVDAMAVEPLKKATYRLRAVRGTDMSPFTNEATATPPAFTGGKDKATCICTGSGESMVCE